MADAEIRFYIQKKRRHLELKKIYDSQKDKTLDKRRFTNYKSK